MATQPTNLPVPSESPRDLKFNAGKIDEFVTSKQREYEDRFGNKHYTVEGLRWVAQQAISAFGYITLKSFQLGAPLPNNELTLPNQVLQDESDGEYYRWDGAFPKQVPAGSTPLSTGGVGVGAWVGVGDASLRNEISMPNGSKEVGYLDGNVYQKLDSTVSNARIVKKCEFKLSTFFDGYDEALAEIGGTYLMPQGFDISDDDYVFINHVSDLDAPTKRAVSVYDKSGAQITWFYIHDGGTQSISVEGSLPSLKIYDKVRGNNGILSYYEIPELPTAGTFISNYQNTTVSSFTTIFAVRNDSFCGFSAQPKIGAYNDDSLLVLRRLSTGEIHASIPLSRAMTGFVTPTISGVNVADYYKLTWKLQGISISCRNTIFLSFGGVYHEDESWTYEPLNNFTDIGVVEISMVGDVISSTVVKNTAYIDYFSKLGVSSKRTENEGVAQDSSGNVYSIVLGDISDRALPNLFIFKEFSYVGEDFSKYTSTYSPPNQLDLENPIRYSDGRYSDPLKRTIFQSVNDLLRYMVLFNIRKFAWYAEIEPQLTFSGVPNTDIQWYELKNLNNGYFVLEVFSVANKYRLYRVQYTLSSSTYSIVTLPFWTNSITTGAVISPGGFSVTVGDGYIYPTTPGAVTLGTNANPYKEIYLQSNPVITSDASLKTDVRKLSGSECELSYILKEMIVKYKLKSSPENEQVGFIAQQIIEAFSLKGLDAVQMGIVKVGDDGMLAVNYVAIMLLIIAGM